MKLETGNWGIWLFRVLVIAAIALMITSFTMPWWIARFADDVTSIDSQSAGAVNIYGWGLRHNLTRLASYVQGDITPFYQTVLAWAYIGLSAGLALFFTCLKGKKGQLLPGIIGAAYIIYVAVAIFKVVSERIAYVQIPLEGLIVFPLIEQVGSITVLTSLQPGYYLAYAAGSILIILALFRGIFGIKACNNA